MESVRPSTGPRTPARCRVRFSRRPPSSSSRSPVPTPDLDLYAALSDAEKLSNAKFGVEYNYDGKLESTNSIDHAAEVVPYCTNP